MDRRILVNSLAVPGAYIETDVWGRQKDGKPRLRRENPSDRSLLNVPPLIAALALFPDPMREDKGSVALPLRDKGYVVSNIRCHVEYASNGDAICTPLRMQVLHDPSVIDLFARLRSVGALLVMDGLPHSAALAADRYRKILANGLPLAELRNVADELRAWLDSVPDQSDAIGSPSHKIAPDSPVSSAVNIVYEELSVDETKRRLVSHFKIDRDRGIIREKIKQFKAQHGSVFCQNCGFSFSEKYGDYGLDVIDVHHTRPLGTLLPNTMTTLSDLMLLCSNCHRIVHRRKTPLNPDELKALTLES